MENKFGKNWIEKYIEYYYEKNLKSEVPKDIKVLNELEWEKIKKIIRNHQFNDIKNGISVFAQVKKLEKGMKSYKIELEDFEYPIELNTNLFEVSIKENDIVKCKIEYTPLNESFNICELEILNLKKENILQEFSENISGNISERINYILKLLGIESKNLMFREKLAFLTRLIPMVVKNYSLIEFSQKGLGKTKIYKNFEKNCYVADSSETVANLIYSGNNKQLGEIANNDVLVLDESQKRTDKEIYNNIQKFLEDGEVPRKTGKKEKLDTSIVIIGNAELKKGINYDEIFIEPKTNLFEKYPGITKELIDRLNYILPSWGCRSFLKNFTKKGTEDIFYLEIILKFLREVEIPIEEYLKEHKLEELSDRAYKSIKNTMIGFIKLLNLEKDDYDLALYLAAEGRHAVEEIIGIIENKPKKCEIFENILRKQSLEKIICKVMGITEKILLVGQHEIYYKKDKDIVVQALDIIGLEEIKIIKKYSYEDDIEEYGEYFFIKLKDCPGNDELEEFFDKLQETIEDELEDKICKYQSEDMNYLYGYKFIHNDKIDNDVIRTYRLILKKNIYSKDKSSKECCKNEKLKVKRKYLMCKNCKEKYNYKEYRENLKKLIESY